MSSGINHDKINNLLTMGLVGAAIAAQSPLIGSAALGFFVGTQWLSPDLDLPHSLPTQRFGFMKFVLDPYRNLVGHHRSVLSHSPILSTFIRLAYFILPVALGLAYFGRLENVYKLFQVYQTLIISFIIGLELSTDTHLILDWQYSLKRKWRR